MTDDDVMTADEHEAMALTARLANVVRQVIGDGPQAEHDWTEAVQHIHAIQHAVMAQAAARAYPNLYRPLGGWPAYVDTPETVGMDVRRADQRSVRGGRCSSCDGPIVPADGVGAPFVCLTNGHHQP